MGSLVNRALVMIAASIASINAQGQKQVRELRNLQPGDYIADARNGGGTKQWKIGRRKALKRRAKLRARKAQR